MLHVCPSCRKVYDRPGECDHTNALTSRRYTLRPLEAESRCVLTLALARFQ